MLHLPGVSEYWDNRKQIQLSNKRKSKAQLTESKRQIVIDSSAVESTTRHRSTTKNRRKDKITDVTYVGDPFNSKPADSGNKDFTIVRNKNIYQLSVPSNYISSPHKPSIKRNDREILNNHFDICLKFDKTFACSGSTRALFTSLQNDNRINKSLTSQDDAYTWLNNSFTLPYNEFPDELLRISKPLKDNQFVQFMKFIMLDFYCNCHRPTKLPINNERTIYVEIFVPILKYFGNFTRKLGFTWCEKQLSTNSIWYVMEDYTKSGINKKFVDGIGVTVANNVTTLIIESSGYNESEDVDHMTNDTLKNMENASDSLKYLISEYKYSSYDTFKKIKVFSIQIIQDRMTLIQYSIFSPQKWQTVKCRSTVVPLSWDDKEKFVKIFEMFSFRLDELNGQELIIKALKRECLGLEDVPCGRSVHDILLL